VGLDNLRELPLLELVEKLIEYDVGERERLIFLRLYIIEGKIIFESDKRFIERCVTKLEEQEKNKIILKKFQEPEKNKIIPKKLEEPEKNKIIPNKLEINQDDKNLKIITKLLESEVGDPNKLESIKQHILDNQFLVEHEAQYLEEKFGQFAKINENEKTIRAAIKTIKELTQIEIGNSNRLESINEKLQMQTSLSISDVKYFNEKASDLKKLRNEQNRPQEKQQERQEFNSKIKTNTKVETDYGSSFTITLKISHILLVSAIIVFGLWFFGLFLIDLYPVQVHLLGLAIGLGIGTAAIYKINKKANRLSQH